jgi:RND family efflux transporter MFP subunit
VRFDASGTYAHGRIVEISRTVDAGSHAFLVKIELPQDRALRSGMFARARFTAGSRTALSIPQRAVVSQGQLATVYVVSANRARMRVVNVGDRSDAAAEVLAGLAAGERVIVSPPSSLRDGDPVREGSRR